MSHWQTSSDYDKSFQAMSWMFFHAVFVFTIFHLQMNHCDWSSRGHYARVENDKEYHLIMGFFPENVLYEIKNTISHLPEILLCAARLGGAGH
jgi:hypothetical protein